MHQQIKNNGLTSVQTSAARINAVRSVALLVLLVNLMVIGSAGQTRMPESLRPATVTGRVLSAADQRPLPRIRVHLVPVRAALSVSRLTDAKGEFEFNDVQPGRYWLRAEHDRLLTAYLGQRALGDPARSVVVRPGEHVADATIEVREFGVITGRVINVHGEPVERATIGAAANDLRITQANDVGEFRIPRLHPGRYLVWAIPPAALPATRSDQDVYEMTFAGNTTDAASAHTINVGHGGESSVGDIVLALGTLTTVSGRVLTVSGAPASGAVLGLAIEQTGHYSALNIARASTIASASGEFLFPVVSAGRYKLRAKLGALQGMSDLVVSGTPVEGLSIAVAPPVTLAGQLTWHAGETPCREVAIAVLPIDALGSERTVRLVPVQANGSFSLTELSGLQQLEVRCDGTAVARIRRLIVDGREVRSEILDMSKLGPNATIQIEVASPANRILGQVVDDHGEPGAGLVVVAVDDQDKWTTPFQYAWTTVVDDKGEFSFKGLPPGNYIAFHEPPRRIGEVKAPEYLQVVRKRATRFTVPETGDVKLSLRCH